MANVAARDILEVWDRGSTRHPCDRAILLLSQVTGKDPETLAALSLDHRNAELLRIRQLVLGPSMEVFDRCPKCQTQVEFEVAIPAILVLEPKDPAPEFELELDGYQVRFRPPNSWDLGAVANMGYCQKGGDHLFHQLILGCSYLGHPTQPNQLPLKIKEAVADFIQEARPLTEIIFTLNCPETTCANRWRTTLDVASFVWHEIQIQAQLILHQIHRLATAYGWSESEILSLNGPRRRFYLELLNA